MTSRWAVDISAHRDLQIRWKPISLKLKNSTPEDSPSFARVTHTHGLLRVMESVRATEGDGVVGRLYEVYGNHIHGAQDLVDPAVALLEANLDSKHAAAFDDPSFDVAIRASMDDGLGLTGPDVGTPILAFLNSKGNRVGFFGPVISRRLPIDESLKLWDGLMLTARTDSFWELKRTRTEGPDFSPVE